MLVPALTPPSAVIPPMVVPFPVGALVSNVQSAIVTAALVALVPARIKLAPRIETALTLAEGRVRV